MRIYVAVQCLLAGLFVFAAPSASLANHPVLVEGEADFDGDGRLGADEDFDGDRVYGTLTSALAADLGAINNNGKIIVVTSGRFPESLLITGANGNVTLEAAPGVSAEIDAVIAGSPASGGNVDRQNGPGVVIDAEANRSIILRNLTIRNWSDGLVVEGESRVVLDNIRLEQNLNHGVHATGRGVYLAIINSQVIGTGFRVGAAGDAPDIQTPDPGSGLHFEDGANGVISDSSSIGNYGKGLMDSGAKVQKKNLILFSNGN